MKMLSFQFRVVIVLVCACVFSQSAVATETLSIVKKREHVQCGVSQGLPGFSNPDDKGNWVGMDVDICRAVAAAAALVSAPVVAAERSAAPVEGESELAGGVGVIIGVLAAAAIVTPRVAQRPCRVGARCSPNPSARKCFLVGCILDWF